VSHILAVTACGSLRVRRLELEIKERVREKGFLDSYPPSWKEVGEGGVSLTEAACTLLTCLQ
jgi:hypothetical protein